MTNQDQTDELTPIEQEAAHRFLALAATKLADAFGLSEAAAS